jgi:hypothetical protein
MQQLAVRQKLQHYWLRWSGWDASARALKIHRKWGLRHLIVAMKIDVMQSDHPLRTAPGRKTLHLPTFYREWYSVPQLCAFVDIDGQILERHNRSVPTAL